LSKRLSLIPVRVVIHSSLVSTIWAKASLVSTNSGTNPPMAVMAAVFLVILDELNKKRTILQILDQISKKWLFLSKNDMKVMKNAQKKRLFKKTLLTI